MEFSFHGFSRRRKGVLIFSVTWWVFYIPWLFFYALRQSADFWRPDVLALCLLFTAFSAAVIVVEIVRAAYVTRWSEEIHFFVVMGIFAVVLVLQLIGVLNALPAYQAHAL